MRWWGPGRSCRVPGRRCAATGWGSGARRRRFSGSGVCAAPPGRGRAAAARGALRSPVAPPRCCASLSAAAAPRPRSAPAPRRRRSPPRLRSSGGGVRRGRCRAAPLPLLSAQVVGPAAAARLRGGCSAPPGAYRGADVAAPQRALARCAGRLRSSWGGVRRGRCRAAPLPLLSAQVVGPAAAARLRGGAPLRRARIAARTLPRRNAPLLRCAGRLRSSGGGVRRGLYRAAPLPLLSAQRSGPRFVSVRGGVAGSVGGRAALGVAASFNRRAPEDYAAVGRRALRPRGAVLITDVVPLPRTRFVRLRLTIRAFPHTQVSDVEEGSLYAPRGGAVAGVPPLLGAAALRLRLRGCASSPAPRSRRPLVAPAAFAAFGLRRPLALLAPATPPLRPLPLRRRSSLPTRSACPPPPRSGAAAAARRRPLLSAPALRLPGPPRRCRRYGRSLGSPPCGGAPRGAAVSSDAPPALKGARCARNLSPLSASVTMAAACGLSPAPRGRAAAASMKSTSFCFPWNLRSRPRKSRPG